MQRRAEMESSNAMWGWIAGAVVLALVLIFVFAQGNNTSDTASNEGSPPAATTGSAPRSPAPPTTTQAPSQTPSNTGQGTSR